MSETGEDLQGRPLRNVTLRVSQIFSACTFCKARKIKCNGATPACGGCVKFGRQATCSLSIESANRGRDYPTYLRQKIEAAQQRLSQHHARQNNLTSPSDTERSNRNESAETHQRSIIDSLIADIGALPIIACSYPSAAEGPTLSSLVLATASTNQLSSALRLTQANDVAPCLPKESTALSLAKHYFDQVYPRIPFFSIQGFWVQFEHVFSGVDPRRERGQDGPPQDPASVLTPSQDDLDRSSISHGYSYFTVLLVLAISASSLSRSADSVISTQAQRLFRTALTFRESAILPNTIIGVQSILFLIQFATLNPSLLDAWYLIGVGMRMCVDLGLHQDPQPLDSVATSLLETRRRLWWSMYSFDRSMSLGCGRPTEISDSAINVSLPTFRIETAATAVEVHGYLQRYRALQIQSEIYNRLNKSPVFEIGDAQSIHEQLGKKLGDWKDSSSQLPNKTLIESEWLMGRMLLLRPCRLLPQRTSDELSELWQAAVGFIAIYRRLVESNSIFYVQIACEKIYWTGLMAFYSYWQLHTSTTGDPTSMRRLDVWMIVKDVMFILRALSERWDQGKLLCGRFDDVSTRVLEVSENDLGNGLAVALPVELQNLEQYTSLTVVWTSSHKLDQRNEHALDTNELRHLVSEML
ncbi:GAL4-like transcriptional activator [Fusarium subglutinans]|uniref:GAL4-like transcriptional activator n=1 Tax=Gibberella subglutinans TaxID=42677 RepID=A0A8H5P1C3_GIBSU|nr:GAL4-like transcriptional activator [Fusarium subglutinans]KAF5583045.1 GAL4-like transcriptional activator [Fusarium subglutinans]